MVRPTRWMWDSRVRKDAPTLIRCICADPLDNWAAQGNTRPEAEAYYMVAIVKGQCRPPWENYGYIF